MLINVFPFFFNQEMNATPIIENDLNEQNHDLSEINPSNGNDIQDVIVYFNNSTYDLDAETQFESHGGIINRRWNDTFNNVSGFSGKISQNNIAPFETDVPKAGVENDENIEVQMNYASLQSQAVNSTWYQNGFKGDTNCSIAVLDSGISPNNPFFPEGYNPVDLSGNIVDWEDFTDPSNSVISDDNGHGTFISSIIGGTGIEPYNTNNTIHVYLRGNYTHSEVFQEGYTTPGNFSIKVFTFNVSRDNSNIFINSSWELQDPGIDKFWVELYKDNERVNFTYNINENQYYCFNHSVGSDEAGIYDLYVKYHKTTFSNPSFSYNLNVNYFAEFYVKNYTYFTGIANGSKLISYKIVNNTGIGRVSDLIEALKAVYLNQTKLHIISICLSVGYMGEGLEVINRVIDDVIEKGVLVVIAVGNYGIQGTDVDSINQLAINKNAIVVGAINDKDQVTSYSSMGKDVGNGVLKPDIVAPGGSTIKGSRLIIGADALTNETTAGYGTSIATAIVSAAINILIEAKWSNWTEWIKNTDLSTRIKEIKATLLMTASETNLNREDDPNTPIDESMYSPSTYIGTSTTLKDVHEGYGRLNIQAAIDALTKRIKVDEIIRGNLTSSQVDPLGAHVFARRINLTANNQYLFNLTGVNALSFFEPTDFDIFLYSNNSDSHGEPLLLASSQKYLNDLNYFYFIPKENETECILTIKALTGASEFNLTITNTTNIFKPYFNITAIDYDDTVKNATIISYQEYIGDTPDNNYTIDQYLFFINYTDADIANVAPQDIYVCVVGNKNYTLYPQGTFANMNYSQGVTYMTNPIRFETPGEYHYFLYASDGRFKIRYPLQGYLNITIYPPSNTQSFPYIHSFNDGLGGWTYDGTGWGILTQTNANDDRSRIYGTQWESLYFGTYHTMPEVYTYQVTHPSIPYPDGDLKSPIFNLTQLDESIQPFIRFGIRTSLDSGDSIQLQISANWSGWIPLKTFTNVENDWNVVEFNLTEYKGYYVQFRFVTNLDNNRDEENYRGFMLDQVTIENYTNQQAPSLIDVDAPLSRGSEFQSYVFTVDYYDADNSYPEYVYLEIDGKNYTMYNVQGDWRADSNTINDRGILFSRSLVLNEIENRTFRIHAYDGIHHVKTDWYNREDDLIGFTDPKPLEFTYKVDGNIVGRKFSNNDITDYYVAGTPSPDERTAWLAGDNTWHVGNYSGESAIYGGMGRVFGETYRAYGTNWNAQLITLPLQMQGDHHVYLQYNYEVSLQQETNLPDDELDKCMVSISTDYGNSWTVLKEYTYQTEDLVGSEEIDISKYSNEVVMIMFTLYSNDVVTSYGYGWILYDIYIGYDQDTDFNAPVITFENPINNINVNSNVTVRALITDDKDIDERRIDLYINQERVNRNLLNYSKSTGILEFEWDTRKYSDGNYTLMLIAFDEGNNRAESSIHVQVSNFLVNWIEWGIWVIIAIGSAAISFVIYYTINRRENIVSAKLRTLKAEKIRLSGIDKEQVIKRIKLITPEEELKRPLTLHCKACNSWYLSDEFDIICPTCGNDAIYASYNCMNCGKWFDKEEPREDYYCPKCEEVRLVRREGQEIEELLAKEGKLLKEFEIEKRDLNINYL